ncbi:MAG: hypothetical protein M1826_001233 [Phylliscum demangeonii]|nr:MAG: hypothetical protein M1826_001233 [Phylliscum demangeonii]
MPLGWYSRAWLAVAILPAVMAVPIAQGGRGRPPSPEPDSRPTTAGFSFPKRDGAVEAVVGFVPGAVGMGIMAVRHQGAIARVRDESKKASAVLQEQQLARMNGLRSQIRQLEEALRATQGDVPLPQAREPIPDVGQQVPPQHAQGSEPMPDAGQPAQPLSARALRGILAAHEALWVCIEEGLELPSYRYHNGFYMVPLDAWRDAVRPCHDKPGWTPDLEVSGNNIANAIQYAARRPASSSSSSESAPSPFAKAQIATSHLLAQTAHAAHRFFSPFHGAALVRAAAKVEKAAPPVWARVAE